MDVVAVATALLLLRDITTRDQVADNGEHASLGDVDRRSDVSMPHPRIECDAGEHSGMVAQKPPFGHVAMLAG